MLLLYMLYKYYIFVIKLIAITMDAVIERKQTAFRLATDLLERLKVLAKKDNRSLNNYVESVLMEIAYREPNAETKAAIDDARSDNYAGTIDTSSYDAFLKSLDE